MIRIWQRLKERAAREDAFSVVELMVGMMLLFVLTYAAFNFSQNGVSLSRTSMYSAEVNQEWRKAMDRMTWQLRVAYYFDPAVCAPGGSSISVFAFTDETEIQNIQFELEDDGKGEGTYNLIALQGGAQGTIATGVESLNFTYYDKNGSEITDLNAFVVEENTYAYATIKRVDISLALVRYYDAAEGTASEGHRMENETRRVSASGVEAVTARNTLQETAAAP